MPGNWFCPQTARIAGVASFVIRRVSIQNFPVITGGGNSNAVSLAQDRGEIANHHEEIIRIFGVTNEGKDAVERIVGVNPFESCPLEIDFGERSFASV